MNIILGRSDSGKTNYIMNIIKNNIANENFDFIYIVPEFLSHYFEKKLSQYTNNQSSFNGEILSFRRLPSYIEHLSGINFSNKIKINSNIRILILKKTLQKINNQLKYYYNIYDKNLILIDIMNFIDEFINLNIDIYQELSNQKIGNKMKDLLLIYKFFIIEMNKNYYDNKYFLTKFLKKLKNNDYLNNKYIFLDQFSNFTNQEFNIIKILLNKTQKIYITANFEKEYNDFFIKGNDLIENLKKICYKKNILINYIYMKNAMLNSNTDIKKLEFTLLNIEKTKIDNSNNINIHQAYNTFDECEFVAANIKELIINKTCQYSDIVIASNNFSKYKFIYEIILKKFNIPFYIFSENNIYENVIIKIFLSTIQVIIHKFNINYLKQFFYSLVNINMIKINEINNMLKTNFCFQKNENIIMKELIKLELFTHNYEQKFDYFIDKLFVFFEKIHLKKNIQLIIEKNNNIIISEKYFKTWNLILDNIKQINMIYKNKYVNFEFVYDTLELIFKTSNINYIPPIINCVICTNLERIIDNKILFIIGCNDNEIPNLNKNQLFTNYDKHDLEKININMKNNIIELIQSENENIYKLLTSAQDKIYISYTTISSEDNQYLYPSYIIKMIQSKILNLKKTTYKELYYVNKLMSQQTILELNSLYKLYPKSDFLFKVHNGIIKNNINIKDIKSYDEVISLLYNVDINLIKKSIGNILNLSSIKLNILSECKLKFLFKYILNLSKHSNDDMFSYKNIGLIKHYILEKLNIFNDKDYYIQILKIMNDYIEQQNIKHNVETTIQFNEIAKEFYNIVFKIKQMFNNINFNKYYCELKFDIPNITNIFGININYHGYIDRLNIHEDHQNIYFQIIDYKNTNLSSSNISDIINNYNLQMYFYLVSIYKYLLNKNCNKKIIPYGYLLIPLKIKTSKLIKNFNGKVEIIEEAKNSHNVLLTNNYYNKYKVEHDIFFGVKKISKTKIINQLYINNLLIFIEQKIKQNLKIIFEKNYIGNPIFVTRKKHSCQYCEYIDICYFYEKYSRFYIKYDFNDAWEIINGKKMDK